MLGTSALENDAAAGHGPLGLGQFTEIQLVDPVAGISKFPVCPWKATGNQLARCSKHIGTIRFIRIAFNDRVRFEPLSVDPGGIAQDGLLVDDRDG